MPWKLYGNYQPVDSAWFPRGFHFMETPFFRAVHVRGTPRIPEMIPYN